MFSSKSRNKIILKLNGIQNDLIDICLNLLIKRLEEQHQGQGLGPLCILNMDKFRQHDSLPVISRILELERFF